MSDVDGDSLLVVMGSNRPLAGHRAAPVDPGLRTLVDDDREVLIGFELGGWCATLLADPPVTGFDTLTGLAFSGTLMSFWIPSDTLTSSWKSVVRSIHN